SSGISWMLTTTQVLAPCRSANARFHTSSRAARAMKLIRLTARLIFTRGFSQSREGRGLGFLATGILQLHGRLGDTLTECAAQGDFMRVQQALAIRASKMARAIRGAAARGFQQSVLAVGQAEYQ